MQVHLRVHFVYQGHRVKLKVREAKNVAVCPVREWASFDWKATLLLLLLLLLLLSVKCNRRFLYTLRGSERYTYWKILIFVSEWPFSGRILYGINLSKRSNDTERRAVSLRLLMSCYCIGCCIKCGWVRVLHGTQWIIPLTRWVSHHPWWSTRWMRSFSYSAFVQLGSWSTNSCSTWTLSKVIFTSFPILILTGAVKCLMFCICKNRPCFS